jgi:hypothetical protein
MTEVKPPKLKRKSKTGMLHKAFSDIPHRLKQPPNEVNEVVLKEAD